MSALDEARQNAKCAKDRNIESVHHYYVDCAFLYYEQAIKELEEKHEKEIDEVIQKCAEVASMAHTGCAMCNIQKQCNTDTQDHCYRTHYKQMLKACGVE